MEIQDITFHISKLRVQRIITAYKIVNTSSPDTIFHFSKSVSAIAAMTRNWINPKKHVNDVSESFAGYFFSTGACKSKFGTFTF